MRYSGLHRFTACLLAACFVLFSVEAGVADVHEATGSPPTVNQLQVTDQAGALAVAAAEGTRSQDPPADDGHPVHVCHCAHTHAIGDFTMHAAAPLSSDHDAAPNPPVIRIPSGRQQEPLIRPPIV
ncbi:MAG TPA: hypothetical protein VFK36_14390 [Gemmatimonadales bacterium]|jgi:hypothetical protein|nr:hypothetical protein [Gemmatimonadales bacterium]